MAEILGRYGADSVVGRFIRRAAPEIHASVGRRMKRVSCSEPYPRWG